MGSLDVCRTSAFLEAVGALHVPGALEDHLDAVGALIVDAAAAHRLGELVQHGPRHPRQVAQVAVLPLRLLELHHRHLDARGGAERERSDFFDFLVNCH